MAQVLDLAAARERRLPRATPTQPRVTKDEVATHYGVSTRTITRWMRRGLPFEKPYEGGAVRFELGACEAWMRRRKD